MILDNLSAHKGPKLRRWATRNNVELCFTPTYSWWANPIEAHFGPLREFVLNNSNHPNHVVLAAASTPICDGATRTPAPPNSSPRNDENEPESEQRKDADGDDRPHESRATRRNLSGQGTSGRRVHAP